MAHRCKSDRSDQGNMLTLRFQKNPKNRQKNVCEVTFTAIFKRCIESESKIARVCCLHRQKERATLYHKVVEV